MQYDADKPRLAVTLGDPAGVGPEVIVGAWAAPGIHARCRPLVVGHPEVLRRAAHCRGFAGRVVEIDTPEDARSSAEVIPCLPSGADHVLNVAGGAVTAAGGQAAYEALVLATELALAGRVDAITTAPLNKAALSMAGHTQPGHTELLAELCGVRDVAMMLYLPPGDAVSSPRGLGVVHATLHMALRDVPDALTRDGILTKCCLADAIMRKLLDRPPRIAVCALNPHAGEQGLFGREEETIIRPAVDRARAAGLDATGPLPADTLMVRAAAGEFDAVVAMYHDQGHIALKLLDMHRAVNITLGLPIVRTSVAHGTAADRAWQGSADPSGMITALGVASDLARRRQLQTGSQGSTPFA